jgi:hypothetical protein
MDRRIGILMLILVCLSAFAFADVINNYVVPSSIPLNMSITATGFYDSNASKTNILCAFYFLDSENNLVYRATDQYTTASGRFTMAGTIVREPTFQRGKTYNLHTECGGAYADANFFVGQKEEILDVAGFKLLPDSIVGDLLYWKDKPELILFLIFMLLLIFIVWENFKVFLPKL